MPAPTLTGDRVVLRPVSPQDHAALSRIRATDEVSRWWGYDDEFLDADCVQFAVLVHGRPIGMIQYAEETDPMYRHAGIDLFLDPQTHGQGYGSEAIRLLAGHLFDDIGHHRLVIDPAAANAAAIAAYRKAGFRPVGVMRSYERNADRSGWHDGLLMELLAGELT
ncbi:GNAT family N-acetyltransferase [Nakamurella leprariae]|uniref:GNAT family N-acetyltransferase n=1 Tax=Nakamurella leprariae TaxID=2803911 RepID=A0A939C2A0_9ACTN|nr:GNAT family protein [Nakamurella leprariae]MBM9468009.1 GNAT family N-acetyltransferase [Nakamurella leprariae]